eukprot:gnl/MRDRNA2_/MRDRNA2_86738_c0_seq1.p1 gnl/MRDRNA2_/MRDRNA2_86738_c0~~gnl/MRDRNA2_/MRDRNA2_86738_c0_seq1.p1  ORF type:complete len:105 (-),score=2.57 gnl/MRDRNA2_/MRDRNA2_86738_c0_seq1:519-833(-)
MGRAGLWRGRAGVVLLAVPLLEISRKELCNCTYSGIVEHNRRRNTDTQLGCKAAANFHRHQGINTCVHQDCICVHRSTANDLLKNVFQSWEKVATVFIRLHLSI